MGRSALQCFRHFSVVERSGPSPLLAHEAYAFFASLSKGLHRLDQSLAKGSVSLRWSVEAMNLLKKMQLDLLALLNKPNLLVSFGVEEGWFDQYMKETATLLDLCNSLKSAASGINRHRMVIDLAIQSFSEGSSLSSAALDSIESEWLDGERKKLSINAGMMMETVRVGGGIEFEGGAAATDDTSIVAVMLAAKCTMAAVSLLLVSAVVSPLPIDARSGQLPSHEFPQLKPFAEALTALVARFHERVSRPEMGPGLVLAEHERVDRAVGDLRAQLVEGEVGDRERLLGSVELLRTGSVGLREGIEMFDAAVDEVFQVVVWGRNEMLGIFRAGALSGLGH